MLFVFDENISKNLAEGLNLLEKSNPSSTTPVAVISAESFMGYRGAPDNLLYEAVGKEGGVLFTKDKDFKQIKVYEKVLEENKGKVLFFKSNKRFIFFWDIVKVMVNNWEEIKSSLNIAPPPYVFEFDLKRGIKECHL